MLIQAKSPYGRMAAVATMRPSSRMMKTWPCSRKTRQSSALWFQPASADSASAPGRPALSRRSISSALIVAIAHLEMRRLAEAASAARHPVGDPVHHAGERNARIAKQARSLGGIVEPGGRRFLANHYGFFAETLAKAFSQPAH